MSKLYGVQGEIRLPEKSDLDLVGDSTQSATNQNGGNLLDIEIEESKIEMEVV